MIEAIIYCGAGFLFAAHVCPVEIEIVSIATVLWQYKVCSAVSFGRIL